MILIDIAGWARKSAHPIILFLKKKGDIVLSKNKDKIRVSFTGGSAEDVTGSQVLIDCPKENKKILVECGLQQGNQSLLKEY